MKNVRLVLIIMLALLLANVALRFIDKTFIQPTLPADFKVASSWMHATKTALIQSWGEPTTQEITIIGPTSGTLVYHVQVGKTYLSCDGKTNFTTTEKEKERVVIFVIDKLDRIAKVNMSMN